MKKQRNYKFGALASLSGLFLAIIACQLTIFMKNSIEEMNFRKTCARNASKPNSTDEEVLKKLGLDQDHSADKFCQHYK